MMLDIIKDDVYAEAMSYAKSGQYDLAINYLLPLAMNGDSNSMNNLGVCYMRVKKFKEAYRWFKKSKTSTALYNILTLYDNDRIKFNLEEYIHFCNILIDRNDPNGYLYLSYIYQNNKRGIEDKRFAYLTVLIGIGICTGNTRKLLFEYSYLNEYGIGCKVDYRKSYCGYRIIAINNAIEESFLTTARYNLGLQLIQGKGCEVNYEEGIGFLTLAAIKNYKDAMDYLSRIFTSIEDIKDLEQAKMWRRLKDGKPLTSKMKRIYKAVFTRTIEFNMTYCIN